MTRKNFSIAALAVLLFAALAAPSALADCRHKASLGITAAGAAIDSSGTAEVRAQGTRQRLKVSIDARVPDGTTFLVFANGMPAGSLTIELGAGELDINNANGKVLPAGVSPVCGIKSVQVLDGTGVAILEGSF